MRPHRPPEGDVPMLSRLSNYFKQNVIAFLALFVALGGTGAYAANTIRSTDIVDGEVKSADVKDQSLTTFDVSTFLGADIVDGSLTAKDIAENEFNFPAAIPAMAPRSCIYLTITGIDAQGDHMLLTPDFNDVSSFVTFGIEYKAGDTSAEMKVCNPTDMNVQSHTSTFNLLVFQH
jgi:hypothetical protein